MESKLFLLSSFRPAIRGQKKDKRRERNKFSSSFHGSPNTDRVGGARYILEGGTQVEN